MSPRWDFICPHCQLVREVCIAYHPSMAGKTIPISLQCTECEVPMEWKPSAPPAIVVKGFNAKNGYSS